MELLKWARGEGTTIWLTKNEAIVLAEQLDKLKETGQLVYLTTKPPKDEIEIELDGLD